MENQCKEQTELVSELKPKVPFSRKSNRIHLTDFKTTKKAPWWEKAPDDLAPFRRDFYTNVRKLAPNTSADPAVKKSEDQSSSSEDEEE